MQIIEHKQTRILLSWLLPLLIMPPIVYLSTKLNTRYTAAMILLMVALTLLLFLSGISRKELGTRRMVLSTIFIGMAIAGRALPIIKPVTALTILAAMYLGKEAGFLVGALSAVLSNFFFGQGPWTPFQMLAWGLIGWLAGILAVPLQRHRWLLLGYGAITGLGYSMLMDVWTVLWHYENFSAASYGAVLITAIPHMLLYVCGNVLFLAVLGKPIGDKLLRIRKKYGI